MNINICFKILWINGVIQRISDWWFKGSVFYIVANGTKIVVFFFLQIEEVSLHGDQLFSISLPPLPPSLPTPSAYTVFLTFGNAPWGKSSNWRQWLMDKCIPLVRELTFENAEELTEEGLPFLILFRSMNDPESANIFTEQVLRELPDQKCALVLHISRFELLIM